MNEHVGWRNRVLVIVRVGDEIVDVTDITNQIKTVGLNMLRDALGNGSSIEIKYMAWGTSSTANAVGQTTLVAEAGRKAVTSQTAGGDGVLTTTTYMAPYDGVCSIEELGWFAGSTATATVDTGILVGRVLYSRAKTALESIQVVRTDTFSEVV